MEERLERGRRRRQEDSRGEREEGRFESEEVGGGGGVMERCERVRSGGLLRKKQNCK
jgi:hypothetical protein